MRRVILLAGLALLLGLAALRVADPAPVQALRGVYFDGLQRLSPRPWQDHPVRVVDIDEAALAAHGQWPWPRSTVATLVDRLDDLGAVVIGLDVLFAEPDRYSPARILSEPAFRGLRGAQVTTNMLAPLDTDLILADSLTRSAVVLGVATTEAEVQGYSGYDKAGFAQVGSDPLGTAYRVAGWTPLVPPLAQAARGVGNINVSPGAQSAVVRKVPLIWQGPDGPMPSLALETLRVALGEGTHIVRGLGDLAGAAEAVQLGTTRIPVTSRAEFWMRFRQDDPRLYVSAAAVLDPGADDEALRQALEGRIVLVGTSAAGLLDIRTTALGESVPGVSIHAQVIEQILAGEFLRRGDVVSGAEVIAFVLIGLATVWIMSRFGPAVSMLAGGVGALGLVAGSWIAFQRGVLVDAAFPVLGLLACFALLWGYQFIIADRERRMVRRSFSQYLAPSVLDQIERGGYRIELGGEMRDVTVMFADIRNFTALSETLEPPELVRLLNGLFSGLSEDILARDGTIDKYIGDSIMALWNVPLPRPGHEREAALAALGMRRSLSRFTAQQPTGSPAGSIRLAVGLASGPALVGNVGSRQRFNYSALGDTVNLAARVETACRRVGFDIVASRSVKEAAPDLAWLPAGALRLKGLARRQDLFILVGDADLAGAEAFAALAQAHTALLDPLLADPEAELSRCRDLSSAVSVDLDAFYQAIPGRLEDFGPGLAD